MRSALLLHLFCLSACSALPDQSVAESSDYYGLEIGMVRTYRSRFPLCGNPTTSLLEKRVAKALPMRGGRAVLVEIRMSQTLALHAIPTASTEVFAETERGFGYYEMRFQDPEEADPSEVEIELAKPVAAGTRWEADAGGDGKKIQCRVEAIEEVTVEAGRFSRCARVRFDQVPGGNTFWFAPGVGMVKGKSDELGKDGRPALEYELIRLVRTP